MDTLFNRPNRVALFLLFQALAVFAISVASVLLTAHPDAGRILLGNQMPGYPLTIQNLLTHLLFAGLGEIVVRWRSSVRERYYISLSLLPEVESKVLRQRDLSAYNLKIKGYLSGGGGYLILMIHRCILQFQSSQSVDQASKMLEALTELYAHRIDLQYSQLRYIAWAIPTFGFIGTVTGISGALSGMGAGTEGLNLPAILGELSYAFDTTLVALVYSAVLMYLIHVVQAMEEASLNEASEYCLTNLINRLYAPRQP